MSTREMAVHSRCWVARSPWSAAATNGAGLAVHTLAGASDIYRGVRCGLASKVQTCTMVSRVATQGPLGFSVRDVPRGLALLSCLNRDSTHSTCVPVTARCGLYK